MDIEKLFNIAKRIESQQTPDTLEHYTCLKCGEVVSNQFPCEHDDEWLIRHS